VGGPSSLVAVPFYQCVGFFLRWQSETAINSGSLPLVPRKGKGKCQRDKETMRCCSRIDEQFLWLLSEMVAPEAFKLVAIFQKLINPIKGLEKSIFKVSTMNCGLIQSQLPSS